MNLNTLSEKTIDVVNEKDSLDISSLNIEVKLDKSFVNLYNNCLEIYGNKVLKENGIDPQSLNILDFMERFFDNKDIVSDFTVDSNANTLYSSITTFRNEAPKALQKLYSLYKIYSKIKELYGELEADNCIESIINGSLFFNDLSKGIYPYCYAFDIGKLVTKGMDFYRGNGNIFIRPPKRSMSFIQQVVQTTAFASNQISGAISYPSLFVILDYYYRKQFGLDYIKVLRDKSDKEMVCFIHNEFQSLIYSLNTPCRDGGESSFVNLSIMDKGFMDNLFKDYIIKIEDDIIHRPNINSSIELSKDFFEYFSHINSEESLFTFPVITLAASIDENGDYIDPSFIEWMSEVNCKKALGNIFQAPPYKYSTCCRLINDFSAIQDLEYNNSFGVGGLEIGSTRVCGINLPRLALEHDIQKSLKDKLSQVNKILISHRLIVEDLVHKGLLPLYSSDWLFLKKQYCTVGFIGAYEYINNLGLDIFSEEGNKELISLLSSIGQEVDIWNKQSDIRFNIEQIPGECMAVRLANIDTLLEKNPNKYKIYSNQYVPLTLSHKNNKDLISIYDRLKLQGQMDKFTTGGAIVHINIDDSEPIEPLQFKDLITNAKDLNVVYFAINYVFSQSKYSKVFSIGKHDICPITNEEVDSHYSRVVGYITRKSNWNEERRNEFNKRMFYSSSLIE